jgi:hypothetical protein
MAGDLYFDKTVLLLHCNGSDASTTFTDSSPLANTVTASGNAQLDTADKKYGTAAALFDGTTDYLSSADSAAWHFADGDFTLECWVKTNGTPSENKIVIGQRAGDGSTDKSWVWYISPTLKLNLDFSTDGSAVTTTTSTSSISASTWTHIAVVRSGSTGYFFIGGALDATTISFGSASLYNSTAALGIGGRLDGGRSLDGWLDDVRITKGVARYTAAFTAPTAELPDGYQLGANDSTEAHQSPNVVLKNLYCPPVSQVNESPAGAITRDQDLTAGSDAQANSSTGGNVGIVSSITIGIDTRDWGTTGIGITINPYRSGTTSINLGIGPYTGTTTIPITINPRRSGTTSIVIGIYGDLTAEAGAQAVTWRPKCVLGGVDISGKLVGAIEIEAEEMAAPVASFSFLPAAGVVDPLAWVGSTVVLSWQRVVSGAVSGERARFTGIVSDPVWDADQRLISISATGDLQSICDGMPKARIAATISNGTWSDVVFGDPADMTGWEYAEALLSTTDDVVWQDASGAIRTTSTVAKASADFTFEDSGRFEQSLRLDYASRVDFVTRANLTFEHRFQRRRQRNLTFSWMPLELDGPCEYLTGGFPLPQRTMIESAANGGGYTVLGSVYYRALWPSGSYNCRLGNPVTGESNYGHVMWVNNEIVTAEWCTGAVWTAAKRWMQTVTETHTLTVNASESQATIGILPIEESYTVESEADDPEWESSLDYTGYVTGAVLMSNGVDYRADLDDDSRDLLEDAQEVALAKARAEIRKSHRGTSVTFQTVYQPMLDLSHTVEVDCAALACQGKVRRIRDRWDIDTGDCTTEITVALHRRNGSGLTSDDTLEAPAKPADPTETAPDTSIRLGFHIGGESGAAPFNEEWDGYITNYPDDGARFDRMRSNPEVAAKVYEEQFRVVPPEIDEEYADPADVTATEVYEVTIPQDNLVLTSY